MMTGLTAMQMANWQMLVMLVASAREDLIGTCSAYRIERDVVQCLIDMNPTELVVVAVNADEQSLFHPRSDLADILAVPRPLAGSVMTVRQPADARSRPPSPCSSFRVDRVAST